MKTNPNQNKNSDFESKLFKALIFKRALTNSSFDTNEDLFEIFDVDDLQYLTPEKAQIDLYSIEKCYFSILQLNIISL